MSSLCQKIRVVIFTFCSVMGSPAAGGENRAKITEVKGRVEIVRARSLKWNMVKAGDYLGHNDKILVHDKASAKGVFADGSLFKLKEKSKLLFNMSRISDLGNTNKIFTLYSGAMYLKVKKPFENYEGNYAKIYLGPLSLILHEGSIIVEKDNEEATPRVGILAGTCKVFNSIGPQEKYFHDGLVFQLDSSGFILEPDDIDAGRYSRRIPWVGLPVIENDLRRGKLLRKRNLDIISGIRLGRVIITEFEFEGEGLNNWDVGKFFSILVAREFSEVSYREFVMIGKTDKGFAQLAEEYEADRIVRGSIDKLEFNKKAVLNKDSTKYELRLEVAFELKVQIYDKERKKVIKNAVFSASLVGKKEEAVRLNEFLKHPLDDENKIMTKTTFSKIIQSLKKKLRKLAKSAV